jgi:hypothetical protein
MYLVDIVYSIRQGLCGKRVSDNEVIEVAVEIMKTDMIRRLLEVPEVGEIECTRVG